MEIVRNNYWMTTKGDRTASAVAGMEAGLISGVVMMLALMVYSFSTGEGFFFPLQQIAATFMGVEALIGGTGTILLGAVIHLVVAAGLGLGFGLMLPPGSSDAVAASWGVAFGAAVWLMMTFAVLPIFNPIMADRVSLYSGWWFAYHLGFGAVLGLTPSLAGRMITHEVYTEEYHRAA